MENNNEKLFIKENSDNLSNVNLNRLIEKRLARKNGYIKTLSNGYVESEDNTIKYVVGGELYVGNTIVNKHVDFVEFVCYKNDFTFRLGANEEKYNEDGELLLRNNARKFCEIDGVLTPIRQVELGNLIKANTSASNRAKDMFYGYALNNEWDYFLTLTFSPKKVDRFDDEAVKALWQRFRRKLQRINKNVKILCGIERHDKKNSDGKSALHFHAFLGSICLDKYMTIAIDPHKQKVVKSKHGDDIYNLTIFEFGFSTIVKFKKNYNKLRVANYCIDYVTKQGMNVVGYNKKRYFHTGNLNFKNKYVCKFSENDINKIIGTIDCEKVKETKNFIIYRKYGDFIRE